MSRLIFVSGPCGCGKSTFTDAYARHLVQQDGKTVYVEDEDGFERPALERDVVV